MRRLVAALSVLILTGCGSEGGASTATAEEPGPAAEGAMCEEHGVLEAVCTKCNPKLAAVFQSKGDWCQEHGFPESFCPICHPEKGGKPAADVGDERAPATGTKVRFQTKETAGMAGIETAAAESRPGGARLEVIATVVYDATRHAQVNARSPGVIKRLDVDIGATVKAGATLALVESAAVGADRSRLRAAGTRVEVARLDYEREKGLHADGITSEKNMLAARQEWEQARADHEAARAALGMVGAGGAGAGGYLLRAPIGGVVTRRAAAIGRMVDLEEVLFEIVDTSTMWVELDVPEEHIGLLGPDQKVTVLLDALPGREYSGAISYVAPEIDLRTRTVKARAAVPNPDRLLRANMYGSARIELGAAKPSVMVPRESVQRAGDAALVFVQLQDDLYEARRVDLGLAEGDHVEVRSGVKAGERVATRGSFLLKTETLKGAIGAGCCEPE